MKYWAIALALAVAFALLPSCQEKSETSRRAVVTAVGLDEHGEAGCRLSIQVIEPLLTSGSLTEQTENPTKTYTLETLSAAGLDAFVTRTGRIPYMLHNRMVVIGLEQAKKQPLSVLLDYFIRSHKGRSTMDVVLCRGEAAALLETPSTGYTIPADQLSMLLQEGNRRGYTVPADLLDIERGLSGMFDVALPIVRMEKQGEKPSITADGTAVFRRGVYAGDLDEAGTRGLLFGRGDMQQCTYSLEGTDGGHLTVRINASRTDVDIRKTGRTAAFTLKVRCQGYVEEKDKPGSLTAQRLTAVEQQLGEAIRQDTLRTLETTVRDWDCDLYGFVRMVKKRLPELTRGFEEEWPGRLPSCSFQVEVSAKLAQ